MVPAAYGEMVEDPVEVIDDLRGKFQARYGQRAAIPPPFWRAETAPKQKGRIELAFATWICASAAFRSPATRRQRTRGMKRFSGLHAPLCLRSPARDAVARKLRSHTPSSAMKRIANAKS